MEATQGMLSYPCDAHLLPKFQYLKLSDNYLDLGKEFSRNKTPQEIVASINKILKLHKNTKLEKLSLYCCSLAAYLEDLPNWLDFALAKNLKELELDFSREHDSSNNYTLISVQLPACLYNSATLEHLKLTNCDFILPSDFTGLKLLQSLSLNHVSISTDVIQLILAKCLQLDSLSILHCNVQVIRVRASHSLKLQRLLIVSSGSEEIEITAPNLLSFAFYGGYNEVLNIDAPCLEEAYISARFEIDFLDRECNFYMKLISNLTHVKILTLDGEIVSYFGASFEVEAGILPIRLSNLRELQLLMGSMSFWDLSELYEFLNFCQFPFVEKIFISLDQGNESPLSFPDKDSSEVAEPSEFHLNHVKMIKFTNFKGSDSEMRLVKFFLQTSHVLENLVLVTPLQSEDMEIESEAENCVGRTNAMILQQQLALLPKASPIANVIFCKYDEDDKAFTPKHTDSEHTFD